MDLHCERRWCRSTTAWSRGRIVDRLGHRDVSIRRQRRSDSGAGVVARDVVASGSYRCSVVERSGRCRINDHR